MFAYTNVDQAEIDKKKCYKINVKSLEVLQIFVKTNIFNSFFIRLNLFKNKKTYYRRCNYKSNKFLWKNKTYRRKKNHKFKL